MRIIEQTDRMVVIRTEEGKEILLTEKREGKKRGGLQLSTDTEKLIIMPDAPNCVTIISEKG